MRIKFSLEKPEGRDYLEDICSLCFFKPSLSFFSCLGLSVPSSVFPSGFQSKIMYICVISPIRATRPSNTPSGYLIT